MLLLMLLTATAAGPISKFEAKPVGAEYRSPRRMGEIERCLIDLPGYRLPMVYQQSDRADAVQILWTNTGLADVSFARVDLHAVQDGTLVRSWLPAKVVEGCAPKP